MCVCMWCTIRSKTKWWKFQQYISFVKWHVSCRTPVFKVSPYPHKTLLFLLFFSLNIRVLFLETSFFFSTLISGRVICLCWRFVVVRFFFAERGKEYDFPFATYGTINGRKQKKNDRNLTQVCAMVFFSLHNNNVFDSKWISNDIYLLRSWTECMYQYFIKTYYYNNDGR